MANQTDDGYEWSKEKKLQLIREYRARPLLWKKNSTHHYTYNYSMLKQVKQDAWDEIGHKLNTSAAACKKKIDALFTWFKIVKNRIAEHKRDNKPAYKSNWFAFKEMSNFFKEIEQQQYVINRPAVSPVYTSTYLEFTPPKSDNFQKEMKPNLQRRKDMAINSKEETLQVPPILNTAQFSTEKEIPEDQTIINNIQPNDKRRKQYRRKVQKERIIEVTFNSKEEIPLVSDFIDITQSPTPTEITKVTPTQEVILQAFPPTEKEIQVQPILDNTQPNNKRRKNYRSKVEKESIIEVTFNSKEEIPQVPPFIDIRHSPTPTAITKVTPTQEVILQAFPPTEKEIQVQPIINNTQLNDKRRKRYRRKVEKESIIEITLKSDYTSNYLGITPPKSDKLRKKMKPNLKRRKDMSINRKEEILQVPPILNITQFSTEKEMPHFIKIIQSPTATEIPNFTPIQEVIPQAFPPIINSTQIPTAIKIEQDQPPLTNQVTQPDEEEIKLFTTFLANKMKKFSDRTKNEVQKEICEIIFRADQGFYERPLSSVTSVATAGRSNDNSVRGNNTNIINVYSDNTSLGVNNEILIKTEYSDGE